MAKKKTVPKKKTISKKTQKNAKRVTRKAKPAATKKPMAKKPVAKKPAKAAKAPSKKVSPVKKAAKPTRISRRGNQELSVNQYPKQGLGSEAAGQSGDIEGISRTAGADSESVEELLEEGQSYEADVVRGVEDAADPDESEVTTEEVPEDDVPEEYGGEDGEA